MMIFLVFSIPPLAVLVSVIMLIRKGKYKTGVDKSLILLLTTVALSMIFYSRSEEHTSELQSRSLI